MKQTTVKLPPDVIAVMQRLTPNTLATGQVPSVVTQAIEQLKQAQQMLFFMPSGKDMQLTLVSRPDEKGVPYMVCGELQTPYKDASVQRLVYLAPEHQAMFQRETVGTIASIVTASCRFLVKV